MFTKLCKNEGNVDVRNMLSDSRRNIINQNKTRLRHVIKFVEFCGRQERISKKQDGRLVGRTSSFRGEYSQLFFHKLSAFLDYSNHKKFFLFKAFASITSAPPLEKSWLRPWSLLYIQLTCVQARIHGGNGWISSLKEVTPKCFRYSSHWCLSQRKTSVQLPEV